VDIHMTETAFLMALDVDDTHSYLELAFSFDETKVLVVYNLRL
jgi:hypothetical protein